MMVTIKKIMAKIRLEQRLKLKLELAGNLDEFGYTSQVVCFIFAKEPLQFFVHRSSFEWIGTRAVLRYEYLVTYMQTLVSKPAKKHPAVGIQMKLVLATDLVLTAAGGVANARLIIAVAGG